MAQDIRDLFKRENNTRVNLSSDHVKKFEDRLDMAFPKKKNKGYFFMKVAASIVFTILGGYLVYTLTQFEVQPEEVVAEQSKEVLIPKEKKEFSLGDVSPELKKIEQYYVTNINFELAQLSTSTENKQLLEGFLNQLSDLDQEYKQLTLELNQIGPNEKTITALIENLQFKLQLLYQLKNKLNDLKESKNEQFKEQSV